MDLIFINKKKKLTISGDTRPCENLMKYAQNADVLLHEVFIDGEFKETNKMRSKKHYIMLEIITHHQLYLERLQN